MELDEVQAWIKAATQAIGYAHQLRGNVERDENGHTFFNDRVQPLPAGALSWGSTGSFKCVTCSVGPVVHAMGIGQHLVSDGHLRRLERLLLYLQQLLRPDQGSGTLVMCKYCARVLNPSRSEVDHIRSYEHKRAVTRRLTVQDQALATVTSTRIESETVASGVKDHDQQLLQTFSLRSAAILRDAQTQLRQQCATVIQGAHAQLMGLMEELQRERTVMNHDV